MHCAVCDSGGYQRCKQALAPAEARLHNAQAVDADRLRREALAAELAWYHVELSALD